MDAYIAWLQTTPLSQAIVMNTWIWPAAETVHFFGLTLVLGVVGGVELREVVVGPLGPPRQAVELGRVGPHALAQLAERLHGLVVVLCEGAVRAAAAEQQKQDEQHRRRSELHYPERTHDAGFRPS